MPSLIETLLPELILIEPGPERMLLIQHATSGSRTFIAAFLSVIGAVGLFVLWDKLVVSIPSSWALYPLYTLMMVGFGAAFWFTRQDIRYRLRTQLAKQGIPICVPCGYNLTGNESGICPECGTEVKE